jgi:3-oxoacyl-(acyl-carrier-protein) synthase
VLNLVIQVTPGGFESTTGCGRTRLCAGESAIKLIDRFDTTDFPTKFAGQIVDFDSEGLIEKKSDRRYDDCLRYTMVRYTREHQREGTSGF